MSAAATPMAAKLALACAVLALAISLWTAVRPTSQAAVRPEAGLVPQGQATAVGAQSSATVGASAQPLPATFAILQSLERRVAQLEKQLKQRREGEADGAAADVRAGVEGAPAPIYSALISPEGSVTVAQDEDGSLRAVNRNPALTGKVLVIEARREDGEVDKLTITVPAPEG